MSIKLYFQHEGPAVLEKDIVFSGGEVHVQFGEASRAMIHGNFRGTVLAFLRNSDDIMRLVMFTDAVRRINPRLIMNIIIPYFPYARQDRVCEPGEALGAKAMANIINSLGYDEVILHDPHSEVCVAALDQGVHWPVENIIDSFVEEDIHGSLNTKIKDMQLIAPDAGAMKKVDNVRKYFGIEAPVIDCTKVRDTKTGEITHTRVNYGYSMKKMDCLIVDDICDGGRTFIEIAKVLQEKGAKSISLYVTHGIFSKGIQPLLDAGISTIYTTDSFPLPDKDSLGALVDVDQYVKRLLL